MIGTKRVHIVCPAVPWPLTSGANIDLFSRIRTLSGEGIRIVLHYFAESEERHPTELNPYCESIFIYPLQKWGSSKLPESIALRADPTLLRRLQADEDPIIFEGLSCCGHLRALATPGRKIVVRIQQLQHQFLQETALYTRNPLVRLTRSWQRKKLLLFKQQLPKQVAYACAHPRQVHYYQETLRISSAFLLPPFSPYQSIRSKEGLGSFCLFQGNLAEKESQRMVIWLLTKVFSRIPIPFVIAGNDPPARIEKLVHLYQHTCLVANPGDTELDDLIQKAQTNILPSLVSAGTGIRLLHALAVGRHCICNQKAVEQTPLRDACYTSESAEGMASLITELQYKPFGEEEILLRKRLWKEHFDNKKNIATLIARLW